MMTRRFTFANCFAVPFLAVGALVLEVAAVAQGAGASNLALTWLLVPGVIVTVVLAHRIVIRHPGNIIGPGLSLVGLSITMVGAADTYVRYGLEVSPGSLPSVETAVWVAEWSWAPSLLPLMTLLFLVFPDGRLPSRRWRWVAAGVAVNIGVLTLATMVLPFETRSDVANPYRVEFLGPVPEMALSIAFVGLIPSIGLCALAMVQRFRRSTGIERLQLKWFAYAAGTTFVLFLGSWLVSDATGDEGVWGLWLGVSVALIVFATALAVLRYRLYDIDRIINRTLVYTSLTVLLGITYAGLVVGLQALLRPVGGSSDLAVVATTLAVAGLFSPARRRVQRAVDRRFNRRSYDAARLVEEFGLRLREEIDLDTLRYETMAVTNEALEPAAVSLWIRATAAAPARSPA
jgi:hypothetical protein